jgi:AraC-like DNA-binding protein
MKVAPMQDSKPRSRHAHHSSRARPTGDDASRARPRSVGGGMVAVRVVGHLIDLGVAAGIRHDTLRDAAGVTDEDLRDPDARVPLAAEIALWQTLARHISDPEFGVRAGGAHLLRTMGLVGYVARFSGTLRGALRRVERYSRVFTEAVEFRLEEGRREIALARAHPALGPGQALAEGYRLAAVLSASRELTGVDIVPTEVTFTYPQPSSTTAHSQYFRCPLHFGAATARVVFRPTDLDLPVMGADETLAGYLSKYAEQVLASLVQGETVRHRARAAIWSGLADGPPALKHVAGVLRMPPRTLQRRLAAEGTSLHLEIEEIRKTMAIAVLRDRSMAVEDVAFLLGYSAPSTFFRSFKRWTGTTPRRLRDVAT